MHQKLPVPVPVTAMKVVLIVFFYNKENEKVFEISMSFNLIKRVTDNKTWVTVRRPFNSFSLIDEEK